MSYVMFMATQILGGAYLYLTYKGIFDLFSAFLIVIIMLALSFHVIVRKPDGTSIRMACFTAILWIAAIFAAKLGFEFRSWSITIAAFAFSITTLTAASFSTFALLQRPTHLDVE